MGSNITTKHIYSYIHPVRWYNNTSPPVSHHVILYLDLPVWVPYMVSLPGVNSASLWVFHWHPDWKLVVIKPYEPQTKIPSLPNTFWGLVPKDPQKSESRHFWVSKHLTRYDLRMIWYWKTYPLKLHLPKRKVVFQTVFFRIYLSLGNVTTPNYTRAN